MKAVVVTRHGAPEVLELQDVETPEPGPGEARVRLGYAGVNFLDTYHRTGAYPGDPPFTPGTEGAGVIDAVGPDVTDLRPGDRVAYAMQRGSYAEYAVVPAWKLAPVPDGMGLDAAAALMVQGMTAHYLATATRPLAEGDVALVHAAAGGVGLLLTQLAKLRGATVIGTVSTEEKAELARRAGADHVVRYTEEDFLDAVRRITGGRGVDVVYDSVGRDTFERSLDCLRPRGYMVLYGQSSGAVPPMDPQRLARGGSLFLTRPSLAHYMTGRDELLERSGAVFEAYGEGRLELRIDSVLPLADAAEAHRRLEGRRTMGKVLLSCRTER